MYTVSNDYLTALATDPIHDIVQLRFWISGALAFTMHSRNIIPGSLSIQKQCMNNDGFGVGGVYAGELNVTIIPDENFDLFDYDVSNAEIRVVYKMGLRKENNEWVYEDVPLGRFLVDDIDFKGSGLYQITAYDKMTLFSDTDIDEAIHGTARQVINSLCTLAGVSLATTAAQFEDFINSALTYRIKPKWVDNARDALAYVCACIGCFATMGRTGDLEIRPLTLDYSEYDDSLSRNERLTSLCAMGKTRVKRVRGNFVTTVTDKNGDEKKEFKRYKADTGRDRGGILDLGDNPSQWNDMQEVVDNLAEEFYDVNYTAATFTTISNPIYDLGDRLRIVHPDSGKTVITLLTGIEWTFHGVQTHKGFGSEKGIRGKSQKSIDTTNEVIAGNETLSATVTIKAGKNDVISITDENGHAVTTVTFASGASTGTVTLDIPANGAVFTFTSTVYGQSVSKMIEGDDEVVVSITVNISIISSVDDVVTVKDDRNVTLATVNCPEV